jgi:hypothetical protein
MVLVSSLKFFILSMLLSGLLVNGLIIPSFAVQPIPRVSDFPEKLIMQSDSSPLKQFKVGIPLPNIFCKSGLVLVFKISDSSPACMKSETAQKLMERGWGVLNEQTVWFEYNPIECQKTQWETIYGITASQISMATIIKNYFKDQGITIIESMWTYYATAHPTPSCGYPSDYSYYFLVSGLDANKMTNSGYKKVDNIPSSAHTVG